MTPDAEQPGPAQAKAKGIIWIASYPKSGNTWVRLFLTALRGGGEVDLARIEATIGIATGRGLIERHLDLCLADLSWQEAAELRPLAYRAMARMPGGPLLVKAHDAHVATPFGASLFPPEATAGCIHLVRDPRDVCLSLAAHGSLSIDEAIADLGHAEHTTGKVAKMQLREFRGSWSSHGESWLAAPMPRLTLRYEDMVEAPQACLGAIARFCGLDAAPDAVARAVEATAFSTLAAKEEETGFRERPDGMARFFRVGAAGQWRETLTAAQVARIERDHGALMRRLGYALVTAPGREASSPETASRSPGAGACAAAPTCPP